MNLRLLSVVALAIVALTGCGKSAPPTSTDLAAVATPAKPDPYAWPDPARFEVPAGPDSCTLLDPKQVELVLGEPLAVPPYRSDPNRTTNTDGKYCTYRGKDLRWIVIDVISTGGKGVMKSLGGIGSRINAAAKGELKLPFGGTTLDGDWDEATIASCCTLMALRDDTLVTINIGGSKATLEQAAKLANDAMKNLAKPLPINGAAGVAAANALLKTIPSVANHCALLTRAEAEAVLGPLSAEPLQGDNGCDYRYTDAQGHADQLGVSVKGNGFEEFRENNELLGSIGKQGAQFAAGLDPTSKAPVVALPNINDPQPEQPGPWDDATSTKMGAFNLVRHDVFVEIGGLSLTHDQIRKLAETVGANLGTIR